MHRRVKLCASRAATKHEHRIMCKEATDRPTDRADVTNCRRAKCLPRSQASNLPGCGDPLAGTLRVCSSTAPVTARANCSRFSRNLLSLCNSVSLQFSSSLLFCPLASPVDEHEPKVKTIPRSDFGVRRVWRTTLMNCVGDCPLGLGN